MFYQNKNTKEVISKSKLTMLPNWREELTNNYIVYSEFHPILKGLKTIKVNIEYSNPRGEKTDFIDIPLNIILENIEDRSIWEGCPQLFSKEIYNCICDIINRGEYPYNRTVADEFCKNYNCSGGENDFLAAIVYTTQNYSHLITSEEKAKELHIELSNEGFYKLTEDIIKSAAGTKRKFLVYLNGTNVFGSETTQQSKNYLYLKDWKDQGYYWMKPRATRKGIRINLGQYIKEITEKQKHKPLILEGNQVLLF